MKILRLGILLTLVLTLPIVGLDSSAARAESKSFRIPGVSFHPHNSIVGYSAFADFGIFATSNPEIGFSAPLDLPQGAVVNTVRMFFIDINPSVNCTGAFVIHDFAGSSFYWNVSSYGSPSLAFSDINNINHTIDYNKYAYSLNWVPHVADSSMVLVGFQIFYTPPPSKAAVIPLF